MLVLASQVEAQLGFDWHWEKLGMQGSGQGELDLLGGDINYRFRALAQPESGQPHIIVDAADSSFNEVELVIHSYSADWLYQFTVVFRSRLVIERGGLCPEAVLSLFNGQIRKAVQSGIQSALQKDVPDGVNKALGVALHKDMPDGVYGLGFSGLWSNSLFDGGLQSDALLDGVYGLGLLGLQTGALFNGV
eukprot:1158496-Pelagomonas_calceolata.AAC.2